MEHVNFALFFRFLKLLIIFILRTFCCRNSPKNYTSKFTWTYYNMWKPKFVFKHFYFYKEYHYFVFIWHNHIGIICIWILVLHDFFKHCYHDNSFYSSNVLSKSGKVPRKFFLYPHSFNIFHNTRKIPHLRPIDYIHLFSRLHFL